jgi:hypothetical protein
MQDYLEFQEEKEKPARTVPTANQELTDAMALQVSKDHEDPEVSLVAKDLPVHKD